ncbi:MAG TPA: hypothetical protein PKV41_06120 [Candidatus Omnitrophota bacterium]|nr:hypothetical protein [Candidatus Omnitrophota bacterium]
MEEASTKITKLLILFIVVIAVIKQASMGGFFEAEDHKGRGYYVRIPEGWKKIKPPKDVVYPDDIEVVTFIPKATGLDPQEPEAYISIFTKKLASALWIEDEIPEIRRSISQAGNKILDQGQIKIDGVISEWTVYHDLKAPALVLEFYMVTDSNIFYKLQYVAPPEKFNGLRRSFESLKESFKFRFSLY